MELDGERLVDRAVRVLAAGGVTATWVVQGAMPLVVEGAHVVDNPDWATGMGSSLRAGLAALAEADPPVDAVVVVPVDQPGLTEQAVRRVVGSADTLRSALVVATFDGRGGHPVLIGRNHWPAVVAGAEGDVGARPVLVARAAAVVHVECADVAYGGDVDVPEDLDRWTS